MKLKIWVGLLLAILLLPTTVQATQLAEGNVSDLFQNDEVDVEEDQSTGEATPFEADEENTTIGQSDRSIIVDLIRMVVALAVILGLIYFLLKFMQKRTRIYQQTRMLENLGGLSLGSNKSVQLIRVGNQYYVIGIGDEVKLIDKIDDEDTIEQLMKDEPSSEQSMNFQDLFRKITKKDQNPYQSMTQEFQSELDQMKRERNDVLRDHRGKGDSP